MRIYIIGHDGITLCREAPATVNDGEVAVASKEELHAAPLSGKRLLALWNALPGVERRRTVGDRKVLIDRLWPAIEALPDPESEPDAKRPSKQDEVIANMLKSFDVQSWRDKFAGSNQEDIDFFNSSYEGLVKASVYQVKMR